MILYNTKKFKFYCNTKEKTEHLCNLFVFYKFSCPGWNGTALMLARQKEYYMKMQLSMLEHRKDSVIYKNIGDRSSEQYLFVIISLHSLFFIALISCNNNKECDLKLTCINPVPGNIEIIEICFYLH